TGDTWRRRYPCLVCLWRGRGVRELRGSELSARSRPDHTRARRGHPTRSPFGNFYFNSTIRHLIQA
ncbi:hypothetical protein J6590_047496, partial [Homalodisca vitripennis]